MHCSVERGHCEHSSNNLLEIIQIASLSAWQRVRPHIPGLMKRHRLAKNFGRILEL